MSEDQEKQSPPTPPSGAQTVAGDAFDIWLHRSLHELYDGVTAEPIPPELLKLIESDRARRRK